MSKKCIYCGAMLPEEAHFCPFCARSQEEPEIWKERKPGKRRKIALFAGGVLLLAVLALLFWPRPKTYEDKGSAELIYQAEGSVWHLVLRNSVSDAFHWREAQPLYERTVQKGQQAAIPLQLVVYDEETQENRAEAFAQLIESQTVTVQAAAGSQPAEVSQPQANGGFANALAVADIVYLSDCFENEITWSIRMKNGDTLLLHEAMLIHNYKEVSYSYETTPLETAEELQSLLDEIGASQKEDTIATVQLAPVRYEGDLELPNAMLILEGSSQGESRTVICGLLRVREDRGRMHNVAKDLVFDGTENGGKAGLVLSVPFFAENCTFLGCETGVLGLEGSWPMVSGSTFRGCKTGICADSGSASARNALYQGNSFYDNETAVQLIRMPSADTLYFIDCVFEGNGTDIDNQAGNPIRYDW